MKVLVASRLTTLGVSLVILPGTCTNETRRNLLGLVTEGHAVFAVGHTIVW